MSANAIAFRSYCWSMGTTSFRTKDFNRSIEEQLDLIDRFWREQSSDRSWKEAQAAYYVFLQGQQFLSGNAARQDKDARAKTSGLVDIGLLTDDRRLTPAGEALLVLSRKKDFSPDNRLFLARDSYLYMHQLLKTSYTINRQPVRPYIILLYLLSQVEYLTPEEFTYLLPLCITPVMTASMPATIRALRRGDCSIDQVLTDVIARLDNYQTAWQRFRDEHPSEELFMEVGFNRKSRQNDRAYFPFYEELRRVILQGETARIVHLWQALLKLSSSVRSPWKQLLFGRRTKKQILRHPYLQDNPFVGLSLPAFKAEFFKRMHIYKMRATLRDYQDLNRRYFGLSDTLLFAEETIRLDVVPASFFSSCIGALYPLAFQDATGLDQAIPLAAIHPALDVPEATILAGINTRFGTSCATLEEARQLIQRERIRRFDRLIAKRFPPAILIDMMDLFESRQDDEIRKLVTDNADVPTIFEYILGILWYTISEKQGDILSFMKLSLDADLLPKTHAGGYGADIVYRYEATPAYPTHTLLLEATLVDDTNQRWMEEEPVTRHLGRYRLAHPGEEAYCVFISTYLDINTLTAFRMKKITPFFDTQDITHYIPSLKILPLNTASLKTILQEGWTYAELYSLLEQAYRATDFFPNWYANQIDTPLRAHKPAVSPTGRAGTL